MDKTVVIVEIVRGTEGTDMESVVDMFQAYLVSVTPIIILFSSFDCSLDCPNKS